LGGGYVLSHFCLRGSRTNRTLIRATGEDHILLTKYGQAKIAWSNFSVRCSHRFFRGHKSGSKNAVNFLDHDGPKKGCNPALRRSVLPLYATQWCQRCKNVTLCQRVTETPAKSRLWIMIFTSVFIRQ
jgi:hypothetical protein